MQRPIEFGFILTPRADPSLLRHIPLLSASVMLEEKTPEKSSRIGRPKRDTCEETVEIDISRPPGAATFDGTPTYAKRVDEEAVRLTSPKPNLESLHVEKDFRLAMTHENMHMEREYGWP